MHCKALSSACRGYACTQGIPLIPTRFSALYAFIWLMLAPLVSGATLLNFPVVIAAHWAPERFADTPNVISMWRDFAGIRTAYVWVPCHDDHLPELLLVCCGDRLCRFVLAELGSLCRWRNCLLSYGTERASHAPNLGNCWRCMDRLYPRSARESPRGARHD